MFEFENNTISDYFIDRLKTKKKRTTKDELLSYIFGREMYELHDEVSINLIADELYRNENNIKKISLLLEQFSIKNKDAVITLLINIYEANGYLVTKDTIAIKPIVLPRLDEVDGLSREFKSKIKSVANGKSVSNLELITYLERIRLTLIAKAMGAIKKKKTRIVYDAITDKNGEVRKKNAVSITEEEESLLPMEQVLPSLNEINTMILNLQSKQSIFPTEEELAIMYQNAREKSKQEKERLLGDTERF